MDLSLMLIFRARMDRRRGANLEQRHLCLRKWRLEGVVDHHFQHLYFVRTFFIISNLYKNVN